MYVQWEAIPIEANQQQWNKFVLKWTRKLNEKKKSFCDGIPTVYECEEAFLNLKDNESPGIEWIF